MFHLFGALAQCEREVIRDRTVAGLASARARGRVGGRPPKLTADQVRTARRLYEERELTVEEMPRAVLADQAHREQCQAVTGCV